MASLLARVDHLVYGTPDLEKTARELEKTLGVEVTPGGQHRGEGTRNALLAFGPSSYLEILGPDPEQPDPDGPRWLGIDEVEAPRLVAWAARASSLGDLVSRARRDGLPVGDVQSGSRERPDGSLLTWQLTDPRVLGLASAVPFFIDWGESPHPARTAARGVELVGLRAEHPDPARAARLLGLLGLDLPVAHGWAPALIASLRTPRGPVELR